jgi:lipid A 3-O-deacylase
MPRRLILFLAAVCLCSVVASARAGDASSINRSARTPFNAGTWELQTGVGLFVSENYHDRVSPQYNDIDGTVRVGVMLNTPGTTRFRRGNFELLGELFGAGVIKGPADVIVGTTLLLRHNIVFPGAWLVPYAQIGGGGAYSDAHKDQIQRKIGAPLSFNLKAGVGARAFVNEKTAIFLEFDYRHLSNAGIASRNRGLNSGGAWLGASFFF